MLEPSSGEVVDGLRQYLWRKLVRDVVWQASIVGNTVVESFAREAFRGRSGAVGGMKDMGWV